MARSKFLSLPSRRRMVVLAGIVVVPLTAYLAWSPGTIVTDGRHDLGHNGIWMSHAYLGDDAWFSRNNKAGIRATYRDPAFLSQRADRLRRNHLTDLFPHLCPTKSDGSLPDVDDAQVERLLDAFPAAEFRVLPWVGGVLHDSAPIEQSAWRHSFVRSCRALLDAHPRLAGIHVNIEPLPSGNADFLLLLEELRPALGPGKMLSVAAYPPPTVFHRFPDVHWHEAYFRQVAARCDQLAVMLYDTALHDRRLYQSIVRSWARDVLDWSAPTPVLLGVPAYEDAGAGYHDPTVENIALSLPAIHAGLESFSALPANYQGVAIYSEWEMSDAKWRDLGRQFLRK